MAAEAADGAEAEDIVFIFLLRLASAPQSGAAGTNADRQRLHLP
jgi:hypothetical protein